MKALFSLVLLLGVISVCKGGFRWDFVFEQSQYAVLEGEPFEYCLLGLDGVEEDRLVNITRTYAVGES